MTIRVALLLLCVSLTPTYQADLKLAIDGHLTGNVGIGTWDVQLAGLTAVNTKTDPTSHVLYSTSGFTSTARDPPLYLKLHIPKSVPALSDSCGYNQLLISCTAAAAAAAPTDVLVYCTYISYNSPINFIPLADMITSNKFSKNVRSEVE